jgi:excinuclease UvrABC helicase subunit UvrB
MEKITDQLKQLELMISQHEDLASKYEQLILILPDDPWEKLPPEITRSAPSPVNIYEILMVRIASLKASRIKLISRFDTLEKLKLELEKALEEEDYEKSAEIRDRIEAISRDH